MSGRTCADDLDLIAMALAGGDKSRDEQRAIGAKVMRIATAVRKMERTLDEITAEAEAEELAATPPAAVQSGNALIDAATGIVTTASAAIRAASIASEPDLMPAAVVGALLSTVLDDATDPGRILDHVLRTLTPAMVRHGLVLPLASGSLVQVH